MQNIQEAQEALAQALGETAALLATLEAAPINHKPSEKWSIGEELAHLTIATNGTALLLSSPEDRLMPSDHPSRSYEKIVEDYLDKLNLSPNIGRAFSDQEPKQYTRADLQQQFEQATQAVLGACQRWHEDNADQWMVWKHPLLGKMTAREMIYFTIYHTRHHLASLGKKAG